MKKEMQRIDRFSAMAWPLREVVAILTGEDS